MTPDERRNPSRVIDQSRRRRIAAGAGVELNEVGDLVKQFDGMAAMMKGMAGLGMRERMQQVQKLQAQMTNPAGRLAKPKGDTGKRLTADERRKQKKQREKDARRRRRRPGLTAPDPGDPDFSRENQRSWSPPWVSSDVG